MASGRRVPALSSDLPASPPRRLRVLLVGFEAGPGMPAGVGGVPVDIVHTARTPDDAATSAEAVGADVVLSDAAFPEIASMEHSAAVALLRSETMHALALEFVEAVLAVASIRAVYLAET